MHIQRLRQIYRRIEAYLSYAQAFEAQGAARVSEFWSGFLADRPNFPDINQITTFRRDGYSYGVGDYASASRAIDDTVERMQFASSEAMVTGTTPAEYLATFDEPLFGAPRFFETSGGHLFSQSFLTNLATSYGVLRSLDEVGKTGPLRVCEIGAGYGGVAWQLHQQRDVASYTVIDLPHNLNLSASYLGVNLPDRELGFVREDGPDTADAQLVFAVPNFVAAVDTRFDVILNTFSMQEMGADTVTAYIDWITGHLADDGVFVFINAHGQSGPQKTSDYGLNRFDVRSFSPFRKSPGGFFNTNPYRATLTPRTGESPDVGARHLDVLGQLVQLGFDDDMERLAERVVSGTLDADDEAFLRHTHAMLFGAETIEAKERAVDRVRSIAIYRAITDALHAGLCLAAMRYDDARAYAEAALSGGVRNFARTRMLVTQALCDKKLDAFDARRLPALQGELRQLSPTIYDKTLTLTPNLLEILEHVEVEQVRQDTARKLGVAAAHVPVDTSPRALLKKARNKARLVVREQLKRLGG